MYSQEWSIYENICEIQNDPSLTFLLRAPKIVTEPLSILQITRQYREIFNMSEDDAIELARITKGYAFAFQALGVCFWENRDSGMKAVLEKLDELLDDFVYKKIWASLTSKEREIMQAIDSNEEKIGNICEKISMSSGSFSKYKEKLLAKGVLESTKYGYVAATLPRFYEVVSKYSI